MSEPLRAELAEFSASLQTELDVPPFLGEFLAAADARLNSLVEAMLEQLIMSPSFESIRPSLPVWNSKAASPDMNAEIAHNSTQAWGAAPIAAPATDKIYQTHR